MTDQPTSLETDQRWMRRALELGAKGVGFTSPNPAVGAVIVAENQVLGEGYHRRAGLGHAEVEAIADARGRGHSDFRTATIYITLEPCSTAGRTGACADALIKEEFQEVVYGSVDPNPAHAGRADSKLRRAGIVVRSGILQSECDYLIRDFRKFILTGRPYVVAKAGMTVDGYLTLPPGEGQWITSEEAREDAMKLRFQSDAILVGGQTVRTDNPKLTLRGKHAQMGKTQPLRIVLSRAGDIDPKAHLYSDEFSDRTRTMVGEREPESVLDELGSDGVMNLLIEGGGDIHGSFLGSGLVDELVLYVAPKIGFDGVSVSGSLQAMPSKSWRFADVERVGEDLRITALPLK